MKAVSMVISRPGRPEKFPLPSNNFSRGSVGGRSRSSRSAPIFYRKNGGAKMESGDQEPYSPKVTCIGQVRARKSERRRRRRCWFWGSFLSGRRRDFRRALRRWVVFFRSSYCKKVDTVAEEDSSGAGRRKMESSGGKFQNVLEIRVARNGRDFDDSCCSPVPRNGLMLTRCSRSAPYRASSLGDIFWRENIGGEMSQSEDRVAAESRIREEGWENNASVRDSEESAVHPVMLTRCKSEAARIRERFDLE